MLSFTDMPYEFVPPKPTPMVIWALRQLNRLTLAGKRHQIRSLEVVNGETVQALQRAGAQVLLLPNHSTHSDSELVCEAYRRLGVRSQFMAAYDVFLRNRLKGWLMQQGGAFSVDRDGSDKRAMKQAIETMSAGDYGLTIFPEGNVYLTNERVMPFLEGAAFMALQAQKAMAAGGELFVVPVAIRVTHLEDRRVQVRHRLDRLANAVNDHYDHEADVVTELTRIGLGLLARRLREMGHADPKPDGDLRATLDRVAAAILERIEQALAIRVRDAADLLGRARRVRAEIHRAQLASEEDPAAAVAAAKWSDDAMLALRVLSYLTDYVGSKPTLDRVAETVEKLAEDLSDELQLPFGPRHAWVAFGKSLAVAEFAEGKARVSAGKLTQSAEEAVQTMLDELSAKNPHPGGERW